MNLRPAVTKKKFRDVPRISYGNRSKKNERLVNLHPPPTDYHLTMSTFVNPELLGHGTHVTQQKNSEKNTTVTTKTAKIDHKKMNEKQTKTPSTLSSSDFPSLDSTYTEQKEPLHPSSPHAPEAEAETKTQGSQFPPKGWLVGSIAGYNGRTQPAATFTIKTVDGYQYYSGPLPKDGKFRRHCPVLYSVDPHTLEINEIKEDSHSELYLRFPGHSGVMGTFT